MHWLPRFILLGTLAACARPPVALVPIDHDVAGVTARVGVVAWAPDSVHLAMARGDRLAILNTDSGHIDTVPGVVPRFVDWAPAEDLLVVDTSTGTNRLLRVRPGAAQAAIELATSKPPAAARWLVPGIFVAIVSGSVEATSFGTMATAELRVLGPARETELFSWNATLPWKLTNDDLLGAWLYAPPRPVVETVLANDLHKPPMFPPFVILREIDPYARTATELPRLEGMRVAAPASWSPDGGRFATTSASGQLVIVTPGVEGAPGPVADEPIGAFPTWNPRASAIHLAGAIVAPDGRVLERLVKPDPAALGVWSPDGSRLALLSRGRLLVIARFALPIEAPDRLPDDAMLAVRDKLRLLGELRSDELIDDDEYAARRTRLIRSLEVTP